MTDDFDAGRYDAVLFDMDGVLLSGAGTDPEVYREAARAAVADCGVADPPADGLEALGGAGLGDDLTAACDDLGVDLGAFWAAREDHAARISRDRLERGSREPFDDVAVLHDLAAGDVECDRFDGGGVSLGVVSNNRQATVEFVAEWAGFDDAVSLLRGRDPTVEGYRRRKPDPHYLSEALDDLDADDALYVGDRETDLLAAERAGADGAFVRRSHNADADLGRTPDYELDSLWELRRL